jgi:hypothetical protein
MRAESVTVVANRDTGANQPFEFIIAVADENGVLHQYSGVEEEIATELISICKTGRSVYDQQMNTAFNLAQDEARERGDTPEMPRNAPTAIAPGTPPPHLLGGMGVKPV